MISLLKEFESLSEQEINDILEEKVVVKLSRISKNSKQLNAQNTVTAKKVVLSSEQDTDSVESSEVPLAEKAQEVEIKTTQEVAEKLKKASTREEGVEILENFCPKKKDLESLAVYIDLPNHKKYTIPELRERIIEDTIGYRLRSRAIQGELVATEPEKLDVKIPEADLSKTVQSDTIHMTSEKIDAET